MRTIRILFCAAVIGLQCAPGQQPNPWAPTVELLPGTPAPADLVGEWTQSHVSTIEFTNPNTGSYSDPSGERTSIRFFPDGTFKTGWLKQSSLYSCTMHLFGYKVGEYTLSGSTLTMIDKEASLTSRDNCHPQWNYKKPVPLKTFTYQPHLGRTKYGPVLVLHRPDSKDEVYEREKGKPLLGD